VITQSYLVNAQVADTSKMVILLLKPIKELHLIYGANINQSAQLDKLVSPLVYKGMLVGGNIGLLRKRERNVYQLNAQYQQGKLYNQIQTKQYYASAQHLQISLGGCYKIPLIRSNKLKGYLGWQVSHQSDFRKNDQFQNSSYTYNLSTSISPTFLIEKLWYIYNNGNRFFLKKQRTIGFSYQLSSPILAGISRPSYIAIRQLKDGSGSTYQNSLIKELIQQYQLTTINQFIAVQSVFNIQFHFTNSNRISLQYAWNFETLNTANRAYKVAHAALQLSLYTRLNSF
jgi:hypothetical protein